jgi:hypothetical protein
LRVSIEEMPYSPGPVAAGIAGENGGEGGAADQVTGVSLRHRLLELAWGEDCSEVEQCSCRGGHRDALDSADVAWVQPRDAVKTNPRPAPRVTGDDGDVHVVALGLFVGPGLRAARSP